MIRLDVKSDEDIKAVYVPANSITAIVVGKNNEVFVGYNAHNVATVEVSNTIEDLLQQIGTKA